jgi:hypothetical protein
VSDWRTTSAQITDAERAGLLLPNREFVETGMATCDDAEDLQLELGVAGQDDDYGRGQLGHQGGAAEDRPARFEV